MFRKRTRLTSQVWTVIFLLLFNDALAQTTIGSVAKTALENSIKLAAPNRTILQKLVEDSKTKISTSLNNEKHESIFTNSTNFQEQIDETFTRETTKQKDSNKSIDEEKIEIDENPEISSKTFDSLDGTISGDTSVKSKLSENNVSDKTLKLGPDEESLPKLSRNKGKPIFLDAFKQGSRHNVKKSDTVIPEFEEAEDHEIKEDDLERKEATTQPTIKKKESLEDFDIKATKKDENNHEKEEKNYKKEEKNEGKEENLSEKDTVSLVNDTDVNFKQTSKNETNLISETDDSIDMEFGPKNDVEVVQNITRSSIMRIVQAAEEKKSLSNVDKSFIDKKTIAKQDNDKSITKKIEGENGDSAASVNDVDLKNDERVKIDISYKPLPSTKIEISAKADIPSFNMDISPSKIDISGKADASSSKIDAMPNKAEIPSSEIHILSSKTDESLSKIDTLLSKSEEPSKTDFTFKENLASKTGESSKVDILSKTDESSKIDLLPAKTGELSKLDILSNTDGSSIKEDSSSALNSSWINQLPKRKENHEAKESTENLTDLSKSNDNVSPAPRARTISFSGINEFIPENVDLKLIIRTTESSPTKRPFQLDKEIEQKPYPYLRTDIKKTIDESEEVNKSGSFGKKIEESTDEVSAYENTIGQRGSDNKLSITEPSVVIDNSIQQFKPTYYKRSGNSTKINSTISDFGLRSTTPKTVQDDVTIELSSITPTKTDFGKQEITQKEVTDKNQGIDLTGNGITETNLQNVSLDVSSSLKKEEITNKGKEKEKNKVAEQVEEKNEKQVKEKDEEKGVEKAKEKGAETFKKAETKLPLESVQTLVTLESDEGNKMDVLSSLEGSKLHFSPTNATESSTKRSVTNIIETDNTQTIGTHNSTESSLAVSITEGKEVSSTTQVLNTNKSEIHVNSVISTSIELPETTTAIEYEFVGLKETTLPVDKTDKDFEESTIAGVSTESYKSTNLDHLSDFGKSTDSDKSTDSVKSTNSNKSTDSEKSTDTDKFTDFKKSTNSGKSTDSEETSTLSYILRDGTTETISESNEGTTISTKETATEIGESTIIGLSKPSEARSTSEDKSSTLGAETMESDESTSFLTTTLISSQETSSFTPETTVTYEETTSVVDVENSSEGKILQKNTTESIDFTDSKVSNKTVTSKEIPISTTTNEQSVTTETTVSWTSTSAPGPKIVSVTSESVTFKSITEAPTDAVPTLAPEDIKVFVRIVFEGIWSDVCPRLESLREVLANLLTTGSEKTVMPKQVIFHQTQCSEAVMALTSLSSSETPLTSLLIYIVDEDGNFDEPMTKLLPNLYKVSAIDFPLPVHSFLLVQETDSGNAIAVIVVSSVAFICLVLLAALLFIMRKRQTRFNYGERCRPVSLDAYSLDSVSAYNSVRRKGAIRASKRSYGNPTFEDSSAIPSHPLNFAGLSSFCNDVNAISEEFTGIPQITAKIDELPQGAEVKNRYANVIPLPETRVPLQRLNNDLLTEYINASYVRGPKNATKYYIACQAPTESSVTDFWRMIWEQQSKVIIMLTDLVENGVEKCSEYIPPSEVTDCHRLYGDYQVTLKKRETKEKYAISTLHLKNLENNTFREVSHIWYLWPTNGTPDSASLIAVLLEARALQRGGPGPIVVHCSPGTGRTGTIIALDLGIRQYEITRTVDVPRVVYTIRRDRAGAVQTKEQYAFIYKALNLYATKLSGGGLEST